MRIYKFKPYFGEFIVGAMLKHGTRYLDDCGRVLTVIPPYFDFKNILIKELFAEEANPLSTSKIQIKKPTHKLKFPTFFVYRDPYEAYCSAIVQGLMMEHSNKEPLWDGDMDNLLPLMAGTKHYCFHLWRDISSIIEETKCEDIKLVHLSELTDFILSQTMEYVEHDKDELDRSNLKAIQWKHFDSKAELIEKCKTTHPLLWDRYMEQIQLDTEALTQLLQKYKWINPHPHTNQSYE